jgi:hypothetical protein
LRWRFTSTKVASMICPFFGKSPLDSSSSLNALGNL